MMSNTRSKKKNQEVVYRQSDSAVKGLYFIGILWITFFSSVIPIYSATAAPDHPFPRKANIFLGWKLTETEARELARWDVVVLDMELQATAPHLLKKIREWNPNIIMLVYITPQEIRQDAPASGSEMRRRLAQGIPEAWYLHDSAGKRLSWWPGTYLLNASSRSPMRNGENLGGYISRFVSNELLSTGLWDGVFYDNAWDNITYFAGSNVDADGDGVPDANANESWRAGMRAMYNDTRVRTESRYLLVGNNANSAYTNELNGMLIEHFGNNTAEWRTHMNIYKTVSRSSQAPVLAMINTNTGNRDGREEYRRMRFGLTSTLLEDGYYSFDYGSENHGQLWRYDEYDVNLGRPVGAAASQNGYASYAPDAWQRRFENGVALVNSAGEEKTVELGADYEKIHGTQDRSVNDGSIVSDVVLPPQDGLVLLRTFERLDDVLIPNGSFVRFLHPDGSRARNGLFVFEEVYQPGEGIAHVDLDGNGVRDTLIVSRDHISAWRDDGLPLLRVFPYTANYTGEFRVAVGDVAGDARKEILVAPSAGYAGPIKIYGWDGALVQESWFPFGKAYKSGYSLAIGRITDPSKRQIIIGRGKGVSPLVSVFSTAFARLGQWFAFEQSFRGGVSVAAGDVNGDGKDEIVVGAGPGKKPIIRLFIGTAGERFGKDFTAYKATDLPGVGVQTLDADFDGKAEIVAISSGAGE